MTFGSRWLRGATAATAVLLLAGCGSDGGTDDLGLTDATGTAVDPAATTSTLPPDPATLCRQAYDAWSSGDEGLTGRLLTPAAVSALTTRTYAVADFGLAGSGADCFITQYDPATGGLMAVADLTITPGSSVVEAVTWSPAGALPPAVTDRLMRSAPIIYPGGVVATTIPAPAAPGPVGGPTADPDGGSDPALTSTVPGPGLPATTAPVPVTSDPGAIPTSPLPTSAPTTVTPSTTTIAPTLQQASDTALAEDCANAYEPACGELERRYAPAGGDSTVATGFADAVIAGDTDTAGRDATPGLLGYVPVLGRGPYAPIDGVDVPGTSFDGSTGRLVFRVDARTIVRCYVAAGLVRHCSSAAG